jgi:ABC-type proline/glycine betaine transport system permease subunit
MFNFLKKIWPIALFVIFVIGVIEEVKTWDRSQKIIAIVSFIFFLCLIFGLPLMFGIEYIY